MPAVSYVASQPNWFNIIHPITKQNLLCSIYWTMVRYTWNQGSIYQTRWHPWTFYFMARTIESKVLKKNWIDHSASRGPLFEVLICSFSKQVFTVKIREGQQLLHRYIGIFIYLTWVAGFQHTSRSRLVVV